ncbi:hypothetical protein EDC01DRAFT_660358 [Geopyxis carbonaria]|nr:hypothetical protein EDC01DRAFT_660358 [Geopyxis carbonaria]
MPNMATVLFTLAFGLAAVHIAAASSPGGDVIQIPDGQLQAPAVIPPPSSPTGAGPAVAIPSPLNSPTGTPTMIHPSPAAPVGPGPLVPANPGSNGMTPMTGPGPAPNPGPGPGPGPAQGTTPNMGPMNGPGGLMVPPPAPKGAGPGPNMGAAPGPVASGEVIIIGPAGPVETDSLVPAIFEGTASSGRNSAGKWVAGLAVTVLLGVMSCGMA